MTNCLASITAFYEQERPNSIFKVFHLVNVVFEWLLECKEYECVMVRVGYLNALAIYHIKIRQYSHSLELFDQILEIYNEKIIDNTNEMFLSVFSNYLSLLLKASKRMTSRRLQV